MVKRSDLEQYAEDTKEFECETEDCAFNHNGYCRYFLVHEEMPIITDDDGCISGVISI